MEKNLNRYLFFLSTIVSQVIQVKTKDGNVFEGIFYTINFKEESENFKQSSIVIKQAVKENNKNDQEEQSIIEDLEIKNEDIVQITVNDVIFFDKNINREEFVTDTEISGNLKQKEKELIPWQPDEEILEEENMNENDKELNLDKELEFDKDKNNSSAGFDQFEVNKKKFGVKTSYDERYYTTALDKNSDFYKTNIKKASQLAKEIENEGKKN